MENYVYQAPRYYFETFYTPNSEDRHLEIVSAYLYGRKLWLVINSSYIPEKPEPDRDVMLIPAKFKDKFLPKDAEYIDWEKVVYLPKKHQIHIDPKPLRGSAHVFKIHKFVGTRPSTKRGIANIFFDNFQDRLNVLLSE